MNHTNPNDAGRRQIYTLVLHIIFEAQIAGLHTIKKPPPPLHCVRRAHERAGRDSCVNPEYISWWLPEPGKGGSSAGVYYFLRFSFSCKLHATSDSKPPESLFGSARPALVSMPARRRGDYWRCAHTAMQKVRYVGISGAAHEVNGPSFSIQIRVRYTAKRSRTRPRKSI